MDPKTALLIKAKASPSGLGPLFTDLYERLEGLEATRAADARLIEAFAKDVAEIRAWITATERQLRAHAHAIERAEAGGMPAGPGTDGAGLPMTGALEGRRLYLHNVVSAALADFIEFAAREAVPYQTHGRLLLEKFEDEHGILRTADLSDWTAALR